MPNRPTAKDVYDLVLELKVESAVQHEKIDQMLGKQDLTNGRVNKLEKDYSGIKLWTLKVLIIVNLAGSFVWIKESRDSIISILKVFV